MKAILVAVMIFSTLVFADSNPKKVEASQLTIVIRGSIRVSRLIPTLSEAYIRGVLLEISRGIDPIRAKVMVERGFSASVKAPVSARNCKDAEITILADEGNFIPFSDGRELYVTPSILEFTCHDVE